MPFALLGPSVVLLLKPAKSQRQSSKKVRSHSQDVGAGSVAARGLWRLEKVKNASKEVTRETEADNVEKKAV